MEHLRSQRASTFYVQPESEWEDEIDDKTNSLLIDFGGKVKSGEQKSAAFDSGWNLTVVAALIMPKRSHLHFEK